jgi:hypothetical protein
MRRRKGPFFHLLFKCERHLFAISRHKMSLLSRRDIQRYKEMPFKRSRKFLQALNYKWNSSLLIILASELESYGCWRSKSGSMSGKDLSLNIVRSSSQMFARIYRIRCPWYCDQYSKFWQLQELDQEYKYIYNT